MATNEEVFQHMNVNELHEVLANRSHVVVDIRDATSFANGHITSAVHLSNESVPEFLRTADPDVPVVVCCYHGISSQQAAQFLISQDFTEVYSLDGGFVQWESLYPESIER